MFLSFQQSFLFFLFFWKVFKLLFTLNSFFFSSYRKYNFRMKETSRKKNINIEDIIIKLNQSPYNQKSFAIRDYEIEGLCALAKGIFLEQPMLLELEAPIQICGDTHGQFKDLQTIFKLFGNPSERNYIFLGDYVDRGKQSLECICLLLAYKIKYPNNFFLLRGNHESSELNKLYGFYDQCKRRTNLKMWKTISDTFNFFPIAAIISNRIFCVHGGLSPHIKNLSCLNSIKRPIDPLGSKIICDLLWSDPKTTTDGWSDNFQRGTSYYYGRNVIDSFLTKNQLDLICRSHQIVEDGYEFGYDKKLITIFSAPNYCGEFTNLAAVLKVGGDLLCRVEQFEGQPLTIKKRPRTVTPIRRLVNQNEVLKVEKSENSETKKVEEIKQRRGTRIVKNPHQQTSLQTYNDENTLQQGTIQPIKHQ